MSEIPFTEKRPWGEFRQFTAVSDAGLGEPTTVKTIFIRKGESLSLQKHALRSEFWRVLSGSPDITIGLADGGTPKSIEAKRGDEFEVQREVEHRISAPRDDVEILEISRGMFKEDDIFRLQDNYGRA
jgi:mannose-1-phosphate guanylyltransferase